MQGITLANINWGLRLVRMLNFDPKANIGPLKVDIAATSVCNYHCQFCGSHSPLLPRPIETELLNLSIIRELLISLRQLGTREILFAGNGEPLLSSAMRTVIAESDGYFHFGILTNGSLLDTVTEAMFAKLTSLTISLNSGNGGSHQVTHGYSGKNQFPGIVDNITRLLSYPNGKRKIKLNYVVTSENEAEVPHFVRMAERWGVGYKIRPVDVRVFGEIKQEIPEPKILTHCYMGFIHTSVTAAGDVLQCFGCTSKPLGNLYNNSFTEIWRNPENRALRMKAASMDTAIVADCYNCPNGKASSEAFDSVYSRIPILSRCKWN